MIYTVFHSACKLNPDMRDQFGNGKQDFFRPNLSLVIAKVRVCLDGAVTVPDLCNR